MVFGALSWYTTPINTADTLLKGIRELLAGCSLFLLCFMYLKLCLNKVHWSYRLPLKLCCVLGENTAFGFCSNIPPSQPVLPKDRTVRSFHQNGKWKQFSKPVCDPDLLSILTSVFPSDLFLPPLCYEGPGDAIINWGWSWLHTRWSQTKPSSLDRSLSACVYCYFGWINLLME